MVSAEPIRTAAWYGDRNIVLDFPGDWRITYHWPRTPKRLSDEAIAESLTHPVGQPCLRELARGKSRPLIIVDDLNRPTPASRVMPWLLRELKEARVSLKDVRILMAVGAHGLPAPHALVKKAGMKAASSCQTLIHNYERDVVKVGRTSFGTPAIVNRAVASSDLVVGVGGVYPNSTAGFGGGSKLALGVLGKQSIMHLHFRHRAAGWGASTKNEFRQDLEEIARMIGLDTMVTLHVNAYRKVVRLRCGDHFRYYDEEVTFAESTYAAPLPEMADVVISNAYPVDTSLTFTWMKGKTPLLHCAPGVTRIMVASCSEGVGLHNLFPLNGMPGLRGLRFKAHSASVMKPGEILKAIGTRLARRLHYGARGPANPGRRNLRRKPILLYRPAGHPHTVLGTVQRLRALSSWSEILRAVKIEQGRVNDLRILVYPCAPLQFFAESRS